MPIRTFVNTDVDAAAELIYTAVAGDVNRPVRIGLLADPGNAGDVYVGGSSAVTADAAATGGYKLSETTNDVLWLDLCTGDTVWAIASQADQKVRVILNGADVN